MQNRQTRRRNYGRGGRSVPYAPLTATVEPGKRERLIRVAGKHFANRSAAIEAALDLLFEKFPDA